MSDRERLLELLRARGPAGVTTFEIRRRGISGNPSQRKAELEDLDFKIAVDPCTEGKRHGRRYTLVSEPAGVGADRQPDDCPHESGPTHAVSPDPSERLFDPNHFRPPLRHDELAA